MSKRLDVGDEECQQTLETEQLKLERDRIALQRSQIFLERWRIDVDHESREAEHASQAAIESAQHGLKAIIFVNAGALVALPSFAKGFGSEQLSTSDLFPAMAAFVVGLTFGFLAMTGAYFTNYNRASMHNFRRSIRAIDLNTEDRRLTAEEVKERQYADSKATKFQRYTGCFQLFSVVAAVTAILAFTAGATFGLMVLT